jgi:hypothetical protein
MQPKHKFLTNAITILSATIVVAVALTEGRKEWRRINPVEAKNTTAQANPTPSFIDPECEIQLPQGCYNKEDLIESSRLLPEGMEIQAGEYRVSRYNANYIQIWETNIQNGEENLIYQGEMDQYFLFIKELQAPQFKGEILTVFTYVDEITGELITNYQIYLPEDNQQAFPESTF